MTKAAPSVAGAPAPADRAGAVPSTAEAEVPMAALFRAFVPRLVALVGLQVVGSLAGLVPLLAVAELARSLSRPGPVDVDQVRLIVTAGACGLLVRLLLTGAATALGHTVDGEAQLALRRRLASHLATAPLAWLARRRSGELAKVVGADVSAMHPVIAHTPAELASAFVVPAASLVYLVFVDWRMTLITLVPVVVAIAIVPLMMTPSREAEQQDFDAAMAQMRTTLVELVRGITVIKVFGGPSGTGVRFRQAAEDFVGAFQRWVRGMAGPAAAMGLVLSPPVVFLTVLLGGTVQITSGALPAADLVPFLLLGFGLTAPVAALGHGFDELQAARGALTRIRQVLRVRPLPAPVRPVVPQGNRIELHGVSFSYEEHEVLTDVDLTLEEGTTTAIVGPSGSGKSTLAHLLLRFADPSHGSVRIGGADLRDLDVGTLHRTVAAVLQDVQVLQATVAENIAVAVPGASTQRIIEAARLANIHERILQLPDGYDTVLEEDAVLSGGEKQRIALARALLPRTPVLVLDEATAFADPLTEKAIQEAVKATARGRTTVIIAHRLSTIVDADQVVVLDAGTIVGAGAPERLAARPGWFADLWQASVPDHTYPGVQS